MICGKFIFRFTNASTATSFAAFKTAGNVPPTSPALTGAGSLKTFLREQEVAYLQRALAQAGGDKEKAAGLLQISLATLYRKLSGDEGV